MIFTLYIKGSTEKVLSLCSAIQFNGSDCPLTTKLKEDVMNACEKMAGQGQRVLAFAQLALNSEVYPENYVFQKYPENYPSGGYSFVGIVGLEDPPKHGVREAIGTCRRAGIKVVMVMVTGDHPLTAESIGRRINLMIGETREGMAKRLGTPVEDIPESHVSSVVIQRNKVAQLTDEEWVTVFQNDEIIFARTSPRDKLMIVKRAQALGHIVGVRGDGVNDAPALQNADLGISMNQSGSDVSKESASMILLDDNFASIVKGIKEGRLIYNNLKKSIQYTLSHIIPEVLPYLLYAMVPIPLAVTAIEMLVIDLGFELMAAVSFAWEPSEGHEDRLMRMPPRRIVTPESIARTHRKQNERQNAVIEPVPDFGSSTEDQDSNFELPSKWRRYHYEIKRMRTQEFWTDLISSSQQEDRLVDKEVLSWSYLEAGVIEALGALTTFFVVLDSWGISISTAIVAQRAGSYFPPQSSPLYLPDGTSINGKDQFEALRQAQSS